MEPDEDPLPVSSQPPSPIALAIAFETGDHEDGHSAMPRAICDPCQRRSVVTIVAIRARIRSASRR